MQKSKETQELKILLFSFS